MILIADSGATKSDWILMNEEGEEMRFQLVGLNPFYVDTIEIINILSKELIPFIENGEVQQIYFYGAGCSSVFKCMTVEEALNKLFENADIVVESDLLGAARALFNEREGIACILGTGSNSCHYDGNKIIENITSLGYFFGDEGSGAHLGKVFLKDYLLGNLPPEIERAFKDNYNYNRDNILDAIYNLPFPNRFLASFCEFYADHLSNQYIFDMVSNSFREFFENQIKQYKGYKKLPVSFVGSVAFFFEPLLRQIAAEFELKIDQVLRSPINALSEYHKS
jgi:N-acetylglucosamine kinase-like BadF-type ATPase